MTFDEVLDQVRMLLQQRGRVTYQSLKRRFELEDEYVEDLKGELIRAEGVAVDEDGDVLVWVGTEKGQETEQQSSGEAGQEQRASSDASPQTRAPRPTEGERRQLTVQFIDLVGSTTLSQQLDPEDYHARVVAYQTACRQVIARYEGHVAQYLGDGVLAYFGYPIAHEDDAARAVHSGLEIVTVVQQLAYTPPLQVRIGIHTGPVVVGEIGAGERTERLALGETPNIAARVQGQAEPDMVVISGATYHLVQGLFECQDRGPQELKGISTPLPLYRVISESAAQSRFEAAVQKGLTPLVGREEELGLLLERWERVKEGAGQVVLLGGEAGIGKSRLVQVLKEQVAGEPHTRLECHRSPYYQNSAPYPFIDLLQRVLQFQREDSPEEKLRKLENALEVGATHASPLQIDTIPLFAALLSLPLPERYPPLTLTPQKQKEKTEHTILAWLLKEAERQPVRFDVEDLHWADPSTLGLLGLLIDQAPTARLLILLTFRPEFLPPWASHSHLTALTLSRLPRIQAEVMVTRVTGGKALPPEVLQQVVAKTDGVPLFVEELTKTVLESGLLKEADGHYELTGPLPPLAIPATLQDSLMARLDRLATVREVAQVGATLGREFSYDLLQAVSLLDEVSLQQALGKLVEAEVLYQRGLPPQVGYLFKHALIQDAAYQSLLKSKRQQYHQQIAQVLEARFPETQDTQPELLAHHYTEAGLIAQAIPYWQKAGQRASQRSAHVEAISHLTKGLDLLKTLPDTPERAQQELTLQIALGAPLQATKGFGASEVEAVYTRARELCQQVEETPQLFPALFGLWLCYTGRAEHGTARELAQQCLSLAQRAQDFALLLQAHHAQWTTSFFLGEFAPAREHAEQGMTLYDLRQHRSHAFLYGGHDPGVCGGTFGAWASWHLGYPAQALGRIHEALILAQKLSHPFSLALALHTAAISHQFRREGRAAQERAEALIGLCSEQGFALPLAWGSLERGWALVEQGRGEAGLAQMRQGLAAQQVTGTELYRPYWLALLAEAYGKVGESEEGLHVLAEALAVVDKNGERWYEAELYRLKGELTLQKFQVSGSKFQVPPNPQTEAEECFLRAIEIARQQQAKSLELRAVMSLSRLWQQQGKQQEAHAMLSEIYNWFTEGFDTKDLQEAKALLDELSEKGR